MLTRTPSGPRSTASAFIIESIAPFDECEPNARRIVYNMGAADDVGQCHDIQPIG